jgi:hypothetical protein
MEGLPPVMIRRIRLKNFMSHVDTVIDLADGLTVLVGPNNSGKSAVVEAIQAVCQNNPTKYMVRHGENECLVALETNDGHVIEWKRKGTVVSYTLDGQDIHRLKGGLPDNLHQLLRLPLIESPDGRDTFDIHIGHQKEPVFLLDQSGAKAAMFFASASDARLLLEMQRRHKIKTAEHRRDEAHFARRGDFLRLQIATLDPIVDIDRNLAEAEAQARQLRDLNVAILDMQAALEELRQQSRAANQAAETESALHTLAAPPAQAETTSFESRIKALRFSTSDALHHSKRSDALARLCPPPTLEDSDALSDLCRQTRQTNRCRSAAQAEMTFLADLQSPPMLAEITPLSSLCNSLRNQCQQVSRLRDRLARLQHLAAAPEQEEILDLQQLVQQQSHARHEVEAAHAGVEALQNLPAVPAPLDVVPLANLTRSMATATADVDKQKRLRDDTEKQLTSLTACIRAWADANPTCPICGTLIDESSLLAGGVHRHA